MKQRTLWGMSCRFSNMATESSSSSPSVSLSAEADGTWIVKGQRPPIVTHQPGSTRLRATCSSCLFDPLASRMHVGDHMTENYEDDEDFTLIFYLWAPSKPLCLLFSQSSVLNEKKRHPRQEKMNAVTLLQIVCAKTLPHAHISGLYCCLD